MHHAVKIQNKLFSGSEIKKIMLSSIEKPVSMSKPCHANASGFQAKMQLVNCWYHSLTCQADWCQIRFAFACIPEI